MKYSDEIQLDPKPKRSSEPQGLDPMIILDLLRRNWYWFAIGIIFGLIFARVYISHTLPVFETSATLLVNENERRSLVDNTELLQGLGLPGGMQNLENQLMIIKSRGLIERTLEGLPFEVEFYFKTLRNKLAIYPDIPLQILEGKGQLPRNTEFSIDFLGNNSFILESEADYYPLSKTATFGSDFDLPGGSIRIDLKDEEWFKRNNDNKLYFVINSRNSLVNHFSSRLNVELFSKTGSLLRVSLSGSNPKKDADFINNLLREFQSISLDEKNAEAERRIQFIDDQLVGISDSLSITENRLQQFRSSNRVMNLSAQGQALIEQVTILENERARLNLEANYYDYLADYLTKDVAGEIPIVPITMGINDPGLTRLVEELAAMQGQLAARGAGEMNPLQRNLEQKVRNTKDALRETLNGLRRANSLARSENQEQINRANSRASSLPVTERQLLGIERKFKLNDELYTFLLETRAEQQMQKASNRADSKIIDRADDRFSIVVAPEPLKITFAGLFAGFVIPLSIIIVAYFFNTKLKDEDLKRMTNMPIVGTIPHNDGKNNKIVFDDPNSPIAEAFRLLRSRMQFLTKEEASPVILITSCMPSDGKTFTTINLASVYSLLDKKTVLLGFDLRKPKIFQDFKIANDIGISTWLIGNSDLGDIIQSTSHKNLFVIPSGPIPPNPSELTALDKTRELIMLLKEKFDYVIIDSSPIGVVSDTYYLASLADACLLVVRPGMTLRDVLWRTLNEIKESGIHSISMVLNDVKSTSKHYGYGEKYGYVSKNEKSEKGLLKRRRKNN